MDSSRKSIFSASIAAFVAAIVIGGSSGKVAAQQAGHGDRVRYAELLEAHHNGSQQVLRVRADTARNRLWVLSLDKVHVYEIASKQLIRRIGLPRWSVAALVCQPDMALDRSGTAVISHNLEPRLWQIDADSFELKEHVIRMLNQEHLDIGFGGLAYAPDGSLLGVTASGGLLWSIDVAQASANRIELDAPMPDSCGLTASVLARTYVSRTK
jgi:hypothetical protein